MLGSCLSFKKDPDIVWLKTALSQPYEEKKYTDQQREMPTLAKTCENDL